MNAIDIENKDRDFILKLNDLRSRLVVRQKDYQQWASPRCFLRRALLFISPLLFLGMGFALIYVKQNTTSADIHRQATPVKTQKAPPPEPVEPRAARREGLKDHFPSENQMPTTPLPKIPEYPAPSSPIEVDQQSVKSPQATNVPKTGPPAADVTRVELVSAHLCNGVYEREPLVKNDVFHPGDDKRAYLWMEVKSTAQPFVMQHIYYLNDRKYCEVSLEIRFPRMRTWSYVTLGSADQVGTWRVDIACKDRVLKTLSFRVRGK
jgi:hypothetical protein